MIGCGFDAPHGACARLGFFKRRRRCELKGKRSRRSPDDGKAPLFHPLAILPWLNLYNLLLQGFHGQLWNPRCCSLQEPLPMNVAFRGQLDDWTADGDAHERYVVGRQDVGRHNGHQARKDGLPSPRQPHLDESLLRIRLAIISAWLFLFPQPRSSAGTRDVTLEVDSADPRDRLAVRFVNATDETRVVLC